MFPDSPIRAVVVFESLAGTRHRDTFLVDHYPVGMLVFEVSETRVADLDLIRADNGELPLSVRDALCRFRVK